MQKPKANDKITRISPCDKTDRPDRKQIGSITEEEVYALTEEALNWARQRKGIRKS